MSVRNGQEPITVNDTLHGYFVGLLVETGLENLHFFNWSLRLGVGELDFAFVEERNGKNCLPGGGLVDASTFRDIHDTHKRFVDCVLILCC